MSHDAARSSYSADTIVVDVPNASSRDDEVDMQVSIDGRTWCRDFVGMVDQTACEQEYRFSTALRRPTQILGELCTVCHTPAEVRKAQEQMAKAANAAEGFASVSEWLDNQQGLAQARIAKRNSRHKKDTKP
jgi:hypothetical protein